MELEAPVPKGQATGRTTRAVEQHMGALKGIDAAQQHAVSLQQSLLQDRALKMSEVTQLATERVLSMPNNTLHPSTRAAMARYQARLAAAREKSAQQQLAAATHRSSGGGGAAAGAAADAWQTVTSPLRRMPPATAPGAGGGSCHSLADAAAGVAAAAAGDGDQQAPYEVHAAPIAGYKLKEQMSDTRCWQGQECNTQPGKAWRQQ